MTVRFEIEPAGGETEEVVKWRLAKAHGSLFLEVQTRDGSWRPAIVLSPAHLTRTLGLPDIPGVPLDHHGQLLIN